MLLFILLSLLCSVRLGLQSSYSSERNTCGHHILWPWIFTGALYEATQTVSVLNLLAINLTGLSHVLEGAPPLLQKQGEKQISLQTIYNNSQSNSEQ